MVSPIAVASLLGIAAIWYVFSRRHKQGLSTLPGPPRLPLIGNILDMPRKRPWLGLRSLSAKYGNMVFLQVPNQPLLVINNSDMMIEYSEQHSAQTSDRKQLPSMSLIARNDNFAFMPYGASWKLHRRLFWKHFHPKAIIGYQEVQQISTQKFLQNLLRGQGKLKKHIMYSISAAILQITYGVDTMAENDKIIAAIEDSAEVTTQLIVSGKMLVDLVPVLRHYPPWLPGGGFMDRMAEGKSRILNLRDMLFRRYEDATEKGKVGRCIVSDIIADLEKEGEEPSESDETKEDIARNLAAVILEAGSETTSSVIQVFFLAMSLYPDVQKKAQAELLTVVGRDRLPNITDRAALVYVDALIKECLRWMPVTPLGVPHLTSEDHEFRKCLIPRGTMVMPNIWACMQDSEVYECPEVFLPERFIGKDGTIDSSVRSPEDIVFGFGRRICPGRFYALQAIFVTISFVLHVFEITPPRDDHGQEIKIKPTTVDSTITCPEDSRCTITSRGPWADALILAADHLET